MKKYLKLFRVKHYLKNCLIFLPLFFNASILNFGKVAKVSAGFFIFCLLASCIYIFNDLIDVEQDRKHPKKKFRPIASGEISELKAKIILFITYAVIICLQLLLWHFHKYSNAELLYSSIILVIYLVINLLYSKWLKNVPIIDVIILAMGFLLRVIYGGAIISVEVSSWLYLTILSISLYMALGKRKGELKKSGAKSRKVLSFYTNEFLDKFMYVFITSAIVFYSLWCIIGIADLNKTAWLLYSVIFVIFIVMKYSLDLENDSLGDPIDVIYSDKILILSVIVYCIYMGTIIYV